MRLVKGERVWLVVSGGAVRQGFFERYVGRGRCRIYLSNDGYYTVRRALVHARKSAPVCA